MRIFCITVFGSGKGCGFGTDCGSNTGRDKCHWQGHDTSSTYGDVLVHSCHTVHCSSAGLHLRQFTWLPRFSLVRHHFTFFWYLYLRCMSTPRHWFSCFSVHSAFNILYVNDASVIEIMCPPCRKYRKPVHTAHKPVYIQDLPHFSWEHTWGSLLEAKPNWGSSSSISLYIFFAPVPYVITRARLGTDPAVSVFNIP